MHSLLIFYKVDTFIEIYKAPKERKECKNVVTIHVAIFGSFSRFILRICNIFHDMFISAEMID